MNASSIESLRIEETRFARFESIPWWDQTLLNNARVLVVGAGALGNELIKNLALLGAGHVVVVDMDHIETSNLSRSVLFRPEDKGQPKARCAARAARQLYDGMTVVPLVGNILSDVGLGCFRWAQVVAGALDNREARVFVNSACARTGRPWIDGGIEILDGIVRGFAPPRTACYECTMSQVDWELLNRIRSCSLLARRAMEAGGTPTTPTSASIIGAIQAQEIVKILHGMDALLGRGYVFEGRNHSSYCVQYPIDPECGWHEEPAPVAEAPFDSNVRLGTLWRWAEDCLGNLDAIDFVHEIVDTLYCPQCDRTERVLQCAARLQEHEILCPECGCERAPLLFHSLTKESEFMDHTLRDLGIPPWDIVWARRGTALLGIEITGDMQRVLADSDAEGKENHHGT